MMEADSSSSKLNRIGGQSDVDVDCLGLGGLGLMEHLVGYDYAILVDALVLGEPPGTVHAFSLDELPDHASHAASAHDTSLQNALKLGKSMGVPLPDRVTVVGIAAQPIFDFGEGLSPAVSVAVDEAARAVLDLLKE